jgi:hypothetical protein
MVVKKINKPTSRLFAYYLMVLAADVVIKLNNGQTSFMPLVVAISLAVFITLGLAWIAIDVWLSEISFTGHRWEARFWLSIAAFSQLALSISVTGAISFVRISGSYEIQVKFLELTLSALFGLCSYSLMKAHQVKRINKVSSIESA